MYKYKPSLNIIYQSPDSEVGEVPLFVPAVSVAPGGDAAVQPTRLQGFMCMDTSTLRATASGKHLVAANPELDSILTESEKRGNLIFKEP